MDRLKLWQTVLAEIKSEGSINPMSLATWIEPLVPILYTDGILILQSPNQLALDPLNRNHKQILLKTAKEIDSSLLDIQFTLEEEAPKPSKKSPPPIDSHQNESEGQKKPARIEQSRTAFSKNPFYHPINNDLTFERFICAYENSFAYNSAVAICENPGARRFNPLFIYGDSGTGKSHLLHAIANRIIEERPLTKVVFTIADEFVNNFTNSLYKKNIAGFSEAFLQADLLIFDEIERLTGKPGSQMELFKIFNRMHQQNKQIVCASTRPPEELKDFDERLLSRLQWGLSVGVQPAKTETREAVLSQMCHREGVEITPQALNYISTQGPTTMGELEGVVIRLSAYTEIYRSKIDEDIAREQLSRPHTDEKHSYSIDRILNALSQVYAIDRELILGKGRSQEVALSRQVGMYIAKNFSDLSLKAIGIEFGGRDHSTVVHAVKNIGQRLQREESLREAVENVLAKCRG